MHAHAAAARTLTSNADWHWFNTDVQESIFCPQLLSLLDKLKHVFILNQSTFELSNEHLWKPKHCSLEQNESFWAVNVHKVHPVHVLFPLCYCGKLSFQEKKKNNNYSSDIRSKNSNKSSRNVILNVWRGWRAAEETWSNVCSQIQSELGKPSGKTSKSLKQREKWSLHLMSIFRVSEAEYRLMPKSCSSF